MAPPRVKHDQQQLRRLIALSFSASELSKYAERWRVFIDREGTADDGARALVRALAARDKLEQLVASLRSHKPLVEWPPGTPIENTDGSPADDTAETVTVDDDGDGDDQATAESAAQPPEGTESPPSSSAAARGGSEPTLVDPFLEPDDQDDERRTRRRAQLIMVGLLTGGMGLGAAGMWLLADTSTRDEPTATLTLAEQAAAELKRSVQAVSQACEIDSSDDSARKVLTAAFDSCSVPTIRPGVVATPAPRPRAPVRSRPGTARKPTPNPARAPACLDRCHGVHVTCREQQCGAEPDSAAQFDSYQKCMAGCATKYTRCRLSCR